MTTLSQYVSQRSTAGMRYQNAVTELLAAMVDLAALDITIENKRAAGVVQPGFGAASKDALQDLPVILEHAVYAPRQPMSARLAEQIRSQADTYVAALT